MFIDLLKHYEAYTRLQVLIALKFIHSFFYSQRPSSAAEETYSSKNAEASHATTPESDIPTRTSTMSSSHIN